MILRSVRRSILTVVTLLLGFSSQLSGQNVRTRPAFPEIEVRVDTNLYALSDNAVRVQNKSYVAFPVRRNDQTIDIFIYLPENLPYARARLVPSADFQIIDSVSIVDSSWFQARIQFTDLGKFTLTSLFLEYFLPSGATGRQEFGLFPYLPTTVTLQTREDEIFVGEEKVFELTGANLGNVKADNQWVTAQGIDYKLSQSGNQLRLHVAATAPAQRELAVPIRLNRPVFLDGKITSELPLLRYAFTARNSRTAFLNLDRNEVILDPDNPRGTEIQIDRNRLLSLKKTYRIETTAEPGGIFVGEIFTRSALSNDKILAWLRPFGLHRPTDGYLYVKDGDELKFITNLSINEKPRITKLLVLHEGGDYTDNLAVFSGERLEVRIEGTGLDKYTFNFDGALDARRDSATATANVNIYRMRIPVNVSKRTITILRDKEPSGYSLSVKEFQAPRPLDFVLLNWGQGDKPLNQLNKPIFYDGGITELLLGFNQSKIDEGARLYGKQYLGLEINIYNRRKDLVEVKRIDNLVAVPNESSPRYTFYDKSDATLTPINLNQYLAHKTFDLGDWNTIEIIVKHRPDKHGGATGFSQKIEIILQRHYTFDIDVSFPAGLLVKKVGVNGFGNLYGISMAMLAQFSFYHPQKIDKPRPFRIGAGFIALNAFNFSENAASSRDLGLVILGSVLPTRTGTRFSFPIYLGGGYLLNADKMFFVLGPGIQLSL